MSEQYRISNILQQKLTAEQAYHYRIVPVEEKDNVLICKTDQKELEAILNELQIVLDFPVELEACDPIEFQQYLSSNYRIDVASSSRALTLSSDFLERIIHSARSIGSSDIHFEPYEHRCRVRFRIDGKLIEQASVDWADYPSLINKIKIRADLDISEKRLPQDGRITISEAGSEFDIRVSTLPTLHGEKLVLRILNKDTDNLSLDSLGFGPLELQRYREGIRNPHGIVLISGPTGSGKTTTLYATLKELNDGNHNILTVEDPIEYTLEGINQVQLRENIGLDFPSTLRTFLRQDPDIVMVGEIRDTKTANMAIRAALTGHLVLSTIHTNSAWATISRLIDMEVPSFLIASTLNMSVAQRLIRTLCNSCKVEQHLDAATLPSSFNPPKTLKTHWTAPGCNQCHHTGYQGRKAIYEVIPIAGDLKSKIKNNALDVQKELEDLNILTLKAHALALVQNGATSIDEVFSILAQD